MGRTSARASCTPTRILEQRARVDHPSWLTGRRRACRSGAVSATSLVSIGHGPALDRAWDACRGPRRRRPSTSSARQRRADLEALRVRAAVPTPSMNGVDEPARYHRSLPKNCYQPLAPDIVAELLAGGAGPSRGPAMSSNEHFYVDVT